MRSLPRLDAQRLLLAVFLGAIFVITAVPLLDTDLWWHLADGRLVLAHGIPSADVFSFTAAGQPWVVHEWLTEVLMYAGYRGGGIPALVLGAALITAVAMYLIYRLLRRGGLGSNAAVVVGVVLGLAASPSWGARPQLITFLFSALLMELLFAYRQRPGRRAWWLVPGFVLWANLHPGFLFGAALVAAFVVAEWVRARRPASEGSPVLAAADRARLVLIAIAAAAAGLATPATLGTYAAFLKVVGSPAQRVLIAEWQSPDFHLFPSGYALLAALVLLLAGSIALAAARPAALPGPDLTEAVLGLGALVFALTAQRNVALFVVAGAPLLGRATAGLLAAAGLRQRGPRLPTRLQSAVNWGLLAVLAILAVTLRVAPNLASGSIARAEEAAFPVAATEYLLTAAVPRPMLNAFEWGGYLDWRAWPQQHVFIDGRVEVYGDAVLRDYISAVSTSQAVRAPVLDRYAIRSILIPAGTSLGAELRANGWSLNYADRVAEIYTRPHV